MLGYKARLERDLARWEEAGLITPENAKAVRADIAKRTKHFSLAVVLGILGAVLLCFAAIAFVAANWQEMSKLTRLVILLTSLWACYGGAWALRHYSAPVFSQAAILLGVGLFGANIMLIAQMYHIYGNPPDAVLTWALGGLLAGVLLVSNPALALTIGLFSLWSWWEAVLTREAHWPFLLAWTAVALPVIWLRWKTGYHLLAIALSTWIVGLGYFLNGLDVYGAKADHSLVIAIGLAFTAVSIALHKEIERFSGFARPILIYSAAITFSGLLAQQFFVKIPVSSLVMLAILSLALILGALYYGWTQGNRALTGFAYLAFSIELLSLYFKTLGTLLDTALFFFLAGLIVIALAWAAWMLHQRQLAAEEASS